MGTLNWYTGYPVRPRTRECLLAPVTWRRNKPLCLDWNVVGLLQREDQGCMSLALKYF